MGVGGVLSSDSNENQLTEARAERRSDPEAGETFAGLLVQ